MTPTEHYKELRDAILLEFKNVHRLAPSDYTENCTNIVMQLIAADRKRVALEARIDERQMLNFHRAYGKDYQETLGMLEEANDDRIAGLKAQQEGK